MSSNSKPRLSPEPQGGYTQRHSDEQDERLYEQVEFYADAHGIDISKTERVEGSDTVVHLFGDNPVVFVMNNEVGVLSRDDALRYIDSGRKPKVN
jgi:hypothetical protein